MSCKKQWIVTTLATHLILCIINSDTLVCTLDNSVQFRNDIPLFISYMIKLKSLIKENVEDSNYIQLFHGSKNEMKNGKISINYNASISNLTMGHGFYMTVDEKEAKSYAMGGNNPTLISAQLKLDSKFIDIGKKYKLEELYGIVNKKGKSIIDGWDEQGYYQNGLIGIQFVDEIVKNMRHKMSDVGIDFCIRRNADEQIKEIAIYNPIVLKNVKIIKLT